MKVDPALLRDMAESVGEERWGNEDESCLVRDILNAVADRLEGLEALERDIESEAIVTCREALREHLGLRAAFIDDGVMLAIKRVKDLEAAIRSDIEDAKAVCGGDGEGCKAFRGYYETKERRWKKCGQCPMDAMAAIMEAMDVVGLKSEDNE